MSDDESMEEEYIDNQLDLVFVCDCTGSMGSYLEAAQNNINDVKNTHIHKFTHTIYNPNIHIIPIFHYRS